MTLGAVLPPSTGCPTETWVEQDVEVLHTVTLSNVKIKKSFCGKGQGAAGAGNAAEA